MLILYEFLLFQITQRSKKMTEMARFAWKTILLEQHDFLLKCRAEKTLHLKVIIKSKYPDQIQRVTG